MPLQIEIEGRLAEPIVVCDHCGERIAEADQGQYPLVKGRPRSSH